MFGNGKDYVKPIQNCGQTIGQQNICGVLWEKKSKLIIIVSYKVVKITFENPYI